MPHDSQNFGSSLAIDGEYIVVGATGDDTGGNFAGAVYIFKRDASGNWNEVDKIIASDAAVGEQFSSYSVDKSGDYIIVSSFGLKAYIFENDGTDNWTEVTKIVSSNPINFNNNFGEKVAISGNYAMISNIREDVTAVNEGAVFFYERDASGSWNEVAKVQGSDVSAYDNFGQDVALSGNLAVISTKDGGVQGGAGYVFKRDNNGNWNEVTKFLSSDIERGDQFGGSIDISGSTIIFGQTKTNNASYPVKKETAYIFEYTEPAPTLHDFTLLASEEITTSKFAFIEGNIHSNENIEIKKGRDGEINGNITAVEEIEVEKKNIVNGNITADEVDADDATVNGSVTEDVVDVVPFPTIDPFSAGSEDVEHTSGTLELAPGSYDDIEVSKRATLILSAGDYYADELSLYKDANLEVDVSNGPVNLYLEDEYRHDKNVEVRVVGGSTRDFTIYSLTTKRIKIHEYFEGNLIAPESREVRLESNTFFKGQICAEDISLKSKSMAVSHNYNGSIPKLAVEGDDENKSISNSFVLDQNYPNPFNPTTTIRFSLPEANTVSVKIFNVQGQLVRTLVNGALASGLHTYEWDTTNDFGQRVSSGIYFYQLQSRDFNQVKKMILMK